VNDLTFCTVVSGDYLWYAPLFVYAIEQQMPEADVVIYSRDPIPSTFPGNAWGRVSYKSYPMMSRDPNTTATLRFLVDYEVKSNVLITDIDILHMAETPSIAEIRHADMRQNNLVAYSNYSQGRVAGYPRPKGVHYVAPDWWPLTAMARGKELDVLRDGKPADIVDEAVLGRVILSSGLPVPPAKPRLSDTHGVHLGSYRKGYLCTPPGKDCTFIAELLHDPEFMALVNVCGAHVPFVKKLFAYWRKELAAQPRRSV
jgi:hypothetical protein